MAHCEKTFPLCSREPPWRFSRASKAIWLYNPRMASLRHRFEEPGDVQDIRLVVDTIPPLAWSAGPDGSAEFFQSALAGLYGSICKTSFGLGMGGCNSSRRPATNSGNIPGSFEFCKAVRSGGPLPPLRR